MKKTLLALTVLLTAGSLSAQNLMIHDVANGNAMVNGQTLNYTATAGNTDTRDFMVMNGQMQQVTVKIRKTVLVLNDASSSTWFCSDQNCYSPATTLSPVVTMASSGTFNLFVDYAPGASTSGITRVRYAVFNTANPNDSAYIVIEYTTPTSVNSIQALKASVSNPMPNPASATFSMNYKLNTTPASAKMVVYNMLGAQVMETEITDVEGTIRMDVSDLQQGIYFCSLVADNKTLATRRLVVTH
jgi:Secretion system C-terminal sorting domain